MSDNNSIAKRILRNLNTNVKPEVNINGQHVEEFIKQLSASFGPPTFEPPNPRSITINMVHGGSAYEGLDVNDMADFDITVLLEEPFVSENLIVNRDDPSGFFTLEWKSHIPDKRLSDCNGYLEAAKLRTELFYGLRKSIEIMEMPNAKITCKDGLAALIVNIEYDTGREVSINLVPQIVFHTWGQCPGLKPLCEMSKKVREYINTLSENRSPIMSFSLAVPGADKYGNPDQLFNISFSLLEEKFVTSQTDLRDMIRLVKFVADHYDWKRKFSFQPYFAWRVAVKYCDKLQMKNLWYGYKALLCYLYQELNRRTIDGYFVSNQLTYKWTPKKAVKFQDEISRVLKMDAKELESVVSKTAQ